MALAAEPAGQRTEGDRREGQGDGLAVERVHGHDRGAEPEGLAQGDVELGHPQAVLHGEQPGGVAEDALALGGGAGQDARVVGQEDARQAERVGHVEEVGGLVGGVAVDGAGQHARVVGHDGDAAPSEMGERGHDRPAELGLDVEQLAAVDHPARARVGSGRGDGGRAGSSSRMSTSAGAGVRPVPPGRGLPGVEWEVGEVAAGQLDRPRRRRPPRCAPRRPSRRRPAGRRAPPW